MKLTLYTSVSGTTLPPAGKKCSSCVYTVVYAERITVSIFYCEWKGKFSV